MRPIAIDTNAYVGNDEWIAASALEHGVALLTLDAHFSQAGGLRTGACLDAFLP